MAANADDIQARLTKKLELPQIRLTLMHSSLVQLVHEFIKQWVIEDVKAFYGYDHIVCKGTWLSEQSKERYERDVLALVPGKAFDASVVWLEESGALTGSQRKRLNEIYAYRHELTHEVIGFIIDVDRTPDAALLTDALDIARDLDRFWKGVEKDMGTYDEHGDIDIDDVHSGRTLVLQLCVEAYLSAEGAEAARE